jgi:hypothetical protein
MTLKENGIYTVERIVDHRIAPEGEKSYLVKWLGCDDPTDLTWEPITNFENVQHEMNLFWQMRQRATRAADPAHSEVKRPPPPPDFRESLRIRGSSDLPSALTDRCDFLAP